MAQGVEDLPSKLNALSSNPCCQKRKTKQNIGKYSLNLS
jgi:hypothetical protein